MGDRPLKVQADDLRRFTKSVFEAVGLTEEHATSVARALVLANLRGQDTHGVVRIPAYLKRIRAELVNVRPRIEVTSQMPFAVVVDADNAMGPVGADIAVAACVEHAERLGVGAATVRHSNHFGAASVYTVPATASGCIALAMSPGSKSLAPYGSREPLLGTNPMALAAPAGRYAPWSMDMAASVAARGHIRHAARQGELIPEGWALDRHGRPTTDPDVALDGGVMLPFAGPKGSAIAMMVDILAGVLAGSAFGADVRDWNLDFEAPANVGHFFLVMKVESFMPLAEFEERMESAIAQLKALKPAEGFDEVLYPGERSGRLEKERRVSGVPVEEDVVKTLRDLAAETGVNLPRAITEDL